MQADKSTLLDALRAQGFDIELGPGFPGGVDSHVAHVMRGGFSNGYLGRTELEALEKATEKAREDFG